MTLLENLQNDIRFYLSGNTPTAPLLKRVLLFLEDGEYTQADAYCEKVLDIAPTNGMAYLYKLLIELKVTDENALRMYSVPFDSAKAYKNAIVFEKLL